MSKYGSETVSSEWALKRRWTNYLRIQNKVLELRQLVGDQQPNSLAITNSWLTPGEHDCKLSLNVHALTDHWMYIQLSDSVRWKVVLVVWLSTIVLLSFSFYNGAFLCSSHASVMGRVLLNLRRNPVHGSHICLLAVPQATANLYSKLWESSSLITLITSSWVLETSNLLPVIYFSH